MKPANGTAHTPKNTCLGIIPLLRSGHLKRGRSRIVEQFTGVALCGERVLARQLLASAPIRFCPHQGGGARHSVHVGSWHGTDDLRSAAISSGMRGSTDVGLREPRGPFVTRSRHKGSARIPRFGHCSGSPPHQTGHSNPSSSSRSAAFCCQSSMHIWTARLLNR
jgi:hypothetical protein